MKIEFPVLESEPLLYFLLHSSVFVVAMASVFFLLGLCMGGAIWGRYKRQLSHAREEIAGQFQEIAVLKRKLAEQSLRPASGPLNPPPALLTEILPSVREVFPEQIQQATRPPTLQAKPAADAPPAAPQFAPAPAAAPLISLTPTPAPLVPVADAEAHADPAVPAPALEAKRKTTTMRRPTVRVKARKEVPAAEVAPTDAAASTVEAAPSPGGENAPLFPEAEEVTPFGFLLGDSAESSSPSLTALAAIIKAQSASAPAFPTAVPAASKAAPPSVTTPLPEIPSVLPEFDPALGLVYKIPPTEKDDLTRIRGIASMLEKRLHELGIYTWRQIASWEDSHVREFSSRLAFKDRISREKWVEQARSLNENRQPS